MEPIYPWFGLSCSGCLLFPVFVDIDKYELYNFIIITFAAAFLALL
jgi:hypothetical protein